MNDQELQRLAKAAAAEAPVCTALLARLFIELASLKEQVQNDQTLLRAAIQAISAGPVFVVVPEGDELRSWADRFCHVYPPARVLKESYQVPGTVMVSLPEAGLVRIVGQQYAFSDEQNKRLIFRLRGAE